MAMTTPATQRTTPGQPSAPAVQVTGLRKQFRRGRWTLAQRLRGVPDPRVTFNAVDGIDLRVEPGEIFGVLGPNGAGKTTTIRMLASLLLPTSGSVRVFGVDAVARPRAVRRLLGVVLGGGDRSVYWKLTGRENLEYFAALHHLPPRLARDRITRLLADMDLAGRADDYVERYSTGMRQRLVLARALLPDPPLLLLDEPTVGLDPQSASHLRDRITELRAAGRTVILTTHYMDEAEQLCDRIAIIDNGRVDALGTLPELKHLVRASHVVRFTIAPGPLDEPALLADLRRIASQAAVEHQDAVRRVTLHVDEVTDVLPRITDTARRHQATVTHVDIVPVTLEEVFLARTGRELRD
jgi:ABC-2 type transport system ATP-binding protein